MATQCHEGDLPLQNPGEKAPSVPTITRRSVLSLTLGGVASLAIPSEVGASSYAPERRPQDDNEYEQKYDVTSPLLSGQISPADSLRTYVELTSRLESYVTAGALRALSITWSELNNTLGILENLVKDLIQALPALRPEASRPQAEVSDGPSATIRMLAVSAQDQVRTLRRTGRETSSGVIAAAFTVLGVTTETLQSSVTHSALRQGQEVISPQALAILKQIVTHVQGPLHRQREAYNKQMQEFQAGREKLLTYTRRIREHLLEASDAITNYEYVALNYMPSHSQPLPSQAPVEAAFEKLLETPPEASSPNEDPNRKNGSVGMLLTHIKNTMQTGLTAASADENPVETATTLYDATLGAREWHRTRKGLQFKGELHTGTATVSAGAPHADQLETGYNVFPAESCADTANPTVAAANIITTRNVSAAIRYHCGDQGIKSISRARANFIVFTIATLWFVNSLQDPNNSSERQRRVRTLLIDCRICTGPDADKVARELAKLERA